jgi:hypothetical protein
MGSNPLESRISSVERRCHPEPDQHKAPHILDVKERDDGRHMYQSDKSYSVPVRGLNEMHWVTTERMKIAEYILLCEVQCYQI